jgi:hypothetical protein
MAYVPNHGTVARFNKGCRCDECLQARPPGKMERAVVKQLAALPEEQRQPALCELALMISRDLDNPKLGSSHAAQARQLRATLTDLAETPVTKTAKLATVTALSSRRAG